MWIVDAEEVAEAVRSVLQSSGVGEWRTGGEGRGGEAAREKRSGNGGRRDINCQSSHHIWMEQCTNYSAVRASLHRTALHCIALLVGLCGGPRAALTPEKPARGGDGRVSRCAAQRSGDSRAEAEAEAGERPAPAIDMALHRIASYGSSHRRGVAQSHTHCTTVQYTYVRVSTLEEAEERSAQPQPQPHA